MNREQIELIDYGSAPELLWSGCARIERMSGGLFRFVGYVEEWPEAERVRWIRAGSLVLPILAINRLCAMTAAALERPEPPTLREAARLVM